MSHESSSEIGDEVIRLQAEVARLESQIAVLREKARTTIHRFQDILGWQQGESRNALICEIRDAVDAALTQTAPKEAK